MTYLTFGIKPIHTNRSRKLIIRVHGRRTGHAGMINGSHGHVENRDPPFGVCDSQIASSLTPFYVHERVLFIRHIVFEDGKLLAEIPLPRY